MKNYWVVTEVPTESEIVDRYRARAARDVAGFEISEYLPTLSYNMVRGLIDPAMTELQWDSMRHHVTRNAMLDVMAAYMPYAFGKANEKRGRESARSIGHFIAWTWLSGDREFSADLEAEFVRDQIYFGKPILRRVCERYGWDWRQWDDGTMTNGGN